MTRVITGAVIVAVACGLVAGLLATGLLNATACRVVTNVNIVREAESCLVCPDTSAATIGFGLLGAAAGAWITWTGRLIRLFRRV